MQVPAEPKLGRPAPRSTAIVTRRRGAGLRFFSPAQIITLAVALAIGSGSAAAARRRDNRHSRYLQPHPARLTSANPGRS